MEVARTARWRDTINIDDLWEGDMTAVTVDGSVSQQHAQDVLQSLLLAQLAATAKVDRHKDPLNWYKTYQSTLEQIGWKRAYADGTATLMVRGGT